LLKAPCKDCPDRYLGCQDHCEKFKEYAVEHKRVRDLIKKQKQIDNDYYEIRNYHVRKDTRK
jgi:hypothetical protein